MLIITNNKLTKSQKFRKLIKLQCSVHEYLCKGLQDSNFRWLRGKLKELWRRIQGAGTTISGVQRAMHAPCAEVHPARAGTPATGVTPNVAPSKRTDYTESNKEMSSILADQQRLLWGGGGGGLGGIRLSAMYSCTQKPK